MKPGHLKTLLTLFVLEGSLALILFMQTASKAGRAAFLNYSWSRLGMAGGVLLVLMVGLYFLARMIRETSFSQHLSTFLDAHLNRPSGRPGTVSLMLAIASLFSIELFLIGYIALPIHMRPLLLWLILTCLQGWLVVRLAYRSIFRAQASLWQRLLLAFTNLTRTQRLVVLVMAILGGLYFLAFIPVNLGGTEDMHAFYLTGGDEYVIYPSVIRLLTPGEDFTNTIFHLLIDYNWWYGYPYLPISAAVLILPRLIYGNTFGDQVQLNLLLLRQFIGVLPMLLSISLLVYLVTRFKSFLFSIGMYLFLLFVPGVIRFNYRFWHPDSLILLLIVLTFFFLQRDGLRFKKDFYRAAVTCALAAVIKLWGFFFFLVIAGYLLAGLVRKVLTFKRTALAGFGFLAVMAGTMLVSSPAYLYPPAVDALVKDWEHQLSVNASGYTEPDPEGVYQTGPANWLRYFDMYFGMKPGFFFFAFLALLLGSLWGSQVTLNRILLGWCLVIAIFLIYFVAVKSFWYMIPLMLPLYSAGLLLPTLADGKPHLGRLAWLTAPLTRRILWGIVIIVYASQFAINLNNVLIFAGS
jgi:hypothetical protein